MTVAGSEGTAPVKSSGLFDRGAIFAGWVGLGMAIVIAIAFELIFSIQTLVFLAALFAGLLIGSYANVRSERRRPWWRVFANGAYAGLVTGIGLAVLYISIRLLFLYADTGFRGEVQGGQLACTPGPDCTYQRYLADGRGPELVEHGVTDAASFEQLMLQEYWNGALILIGTTLVGALAGAGMRGVTAKPATAPPTASSGAAPA